MAEIRTAVIVHHDADLEAARFIGSRLQERGYEPVLTGLEIVVGMNPTAEVAALLTGMQPTVLCISVDGFVDGTLWQVAETLASHSRQGARRSVFPALIGPREVHVEPLLRVLGNPLAANCRGVRFEEGVRELVEAVAGTYRLAGEAISQPLEALIPRYLDAAREANRYIPVVGGEARIRLDLTLEQVFVPLRAMLHTSLLEEESRWSFHAPTRGASPRKRARKQASSEAPLPDDCAHQQDIDLEQAFGVAREHDRRAVIILGDPGSGKTTLLKRLLVTCVDQGSAALGLPDEILPVMLPLRNLRDLSRGLDAFIQSQLDDNPQIGLPDGFGKQLLERGRLLFLLDGLDEVANAAQRVQVRDWIDKAVQVRPDCWFVVTSRYAGYQGEARFGSRFLELHVRPFEDTQAEQFVLQWYRTIERHLRGRTRQAEVTAEEQARELWSRLATEEFRSRRLRELIGNPLLLTILCFVHRVEGDLPRQRALLYEACVKVLLEHWHKTKKLDMPFEGREARKALQPVAWWMHQQEGRARATAAELEAVLAEPLRRLRRDPSEARGFLETIRDRSGLLVGWDVDSFGFMHLSFQEYLAALEAWREDRVEEVAGHFGESWWKEMTLLLLAHPEKPVFERFMRHLVRSERFVQHGDLVGLCLEESAEVSATPFLEVLEPEVELRWESRYAALQALKGMDDPRIVETCKRLRSSSHAPIRQLQARDETNESGCPSSGAWRRIGRCSASERGFP